MADFNAEEFLNTEVTWEKFDELKKPELFALSQYYDLGLKQATRKPIIKNALIDVLIGEEILDPSFSERKVDIQTQFGGDAVKLKELEIQLEMKKMDQEQMKYEIEMQQKEKLEIIKLENETKRKWLLNNKRQIWNNKNWTWRNKKLTWKNKRWRLN